MDLIFIILLIGYHAPCNLIASYYHHNSLPLYKSKRDAPTHTQKVNLTNILTPVAVEFFDFEAFHIFTVLLEYISGYRVPPAIHIIPRETDGLCFLIPLL